MDGIQAGHDNTKSSLWNRLHWTSNHYFSRGNLENETILSSVHFNFSLGWLFSTIFLDFQRARQYCAPPFSWIHLHSSISQKNIQTFISLKISPPSWKIILRVIENDSISFTLLSTWGFWGLKPYFHSQARENKAFGLKNLMFQEAWIISRTYSTTLIIVI